VVGHTPSGGLAVLSVRATVVRKALVSEKRRNGSQCFRGANICAGFKVVRRGGEKRRFIDHVMFDIGSSHSNDHEHLVII